MKRRYQIEQQRAVNEFRRFANEDNPTVQMPLPMKEVLCMMQSGVGNLLRQAGLELGGRQSCDARIVGNVARALAEIGDAACVGIPICVRYAARLCTVISN